MTRTASSCALSLAILGAGLFGCAHERVQMIAVAHVTVIDMTGEPSRVDQTVLISKQRIAVIGPSSAIAIPHGAEILDGAGKFLIPGLFDMHVHLTAAGEPDGSRRFMLPLLLANGITTVRDMGGYFESIRALQNEIAEGLRLGPQIFTPGPFLDGSPPSFQPSIVVTTPAQAANAVERLVAERVDFIKVQSMLNRQSYFATAKAAHGKNIPFAGHVPDLVTAAEAANAGQQSIEHLTNILRACSQNEPALMREQFRITNSTENPAQSHQRLFQWLHELLASYSPEAATRLFATLKQADVWQTPTLILLQKDAFPTLENIDASDIRTQSIPIRTLENWKKSHIAQMDLVTPRDSELRALLFARSMHIVGEMKNHGVSLLLGTDSPAPYVFPGSSAHEELQLLVRAGLTPFEALQAATVRPAAFLHIAKDYGTVESGKYADLVLLDGNPLTDIANSHKIRAVILHGKLLDRGYLDRSLNDEKSFAAHN